MTTMLQHLKDRHIDTDLHNVWTCDEERIAKFPLLNLSGQMVGYQAYRPDASKEKKNDIYGRYYTYRGEKLIAKHSKSVTVWGLESWRLSNTLFVTEGIFDAARFTMLGTSAIAVLSNDPSTSTKLWLMCIRQMRPVIAICDPGKAGNKLAKIGHTSHVVNVPGHPDYDLGDAPDQYVWDLIEKYS